VFVASDAGRVGSLGETPYSAAKGAIVSITRTMAAEYAEAGIRINAVALGTTRTANFERVARSAGHPADYAKLGRQLPRGRVLEPEEAAAAWTTLFAGTALVALGSAWYHSAPGNMTLVWDRLPIGIAFMGFFTALLVEHLEEPAKGIAQRLLWPLVALSLGALWWWHMSGDLSLWVWVQAAPMLAIVLFLALLPGRYTHRRYFAYALAFYAAAKLFEIADVQLMQWTGGLMSGHTLKHFAAAAGVWCFYVMLSRRATRSRSR